MKALCFGCLVALIVLGNPWIARAGSCCERCGCQQQCRKVCRLVCDTKEVKETCYSLVCEDYCQPGPPACCAKSKCNGCSSCAHGTTVTCGPVRTRARLVKREITRKIPITKCVIETLCNGCCDQDFVSKTVQAAVPIVPVTSSLEDGLDIPAPPVPRE